MLMVNPISGAYKAKLKPGKTMLRARKIRMSCTGLALPFKP